MGLARRSSATTTMGGRTITMGRVGRRTPPRNDAAEIASVPHAIGAAAEDVGDALGHIPVAGKVLAAPFRVVEAGSNLAEGLIHGDPVGGVVNAVKAFVPFV